MDFQNIHLRGCNLLGIALLLAIAMPANASRTDQIARNETIVRQTFDNWAEGGNVFAELLAPDIRWTIHGSGTVAGTYTGIDSFVEEASLPLISRLSTPLVPDLHAIWAVDDTVVIRFKGQATTTSGAPYVNQFVWIFRMENGQVAEAEAFLDLVAYQYVLDNNDPRED